MNMGRGLAVAAWMVMASGGWAQQATVQDGKTTPLWAGAAPGAKGDKEIDQPTLTAYLPASNPTKTAVVVAPGGGYAHLSMVKEGSDVAHWLNERGVAALVTDGAVRDRAGVVSTELPVWCAGVAAPPSVAGLTFVGWQEPIGCGGVAVFPGDVVVADEDGAVLVPQALLDDVVATAAEQERLEAWIMSEVEGGAALPGLYPPNAESKARYEAWARRR